MDLIQEQREIELSMATRGIERYRRNAQENAQNGEATRTKSTQIVMDTALDSLSEAIDAGRAGAASGKAGRRHSMFKLIGDLESAALAYIALHVTLDLIHKDPAAAGVACAIGRAIETEVRMAAFEKANAAYVHAVLKDLDSRSGHLRHRRAVLNKILREKGDAWDGWTEAEHMHVGMKLLEMLMESTGLITISLTKSGKKTVANIHATPRFKDWLYSLDTQLALFSPEYLPCVIPPKDWVDPWTGAYHTDAIAFPPKLVKSNLKAYRDILLRADLSKVMKAVNLIQRTPWQVNKRVLAVVDQLLEERRCTAGLPEFDDLPLPTKPIDIDTNEEARTAWKRAAAQVYDSNRQTTGRRIGSLRNIHTAREFAKYERIYFPHQLDFRGRVYPIPQGLNPQGSDLGKGLLQFADGDRLDTVSAMHWFKVHGANCFGVDKVSFDDRMKWVDDNAEHIIRSAEDPLGYQWWADAESPFCFLAWAFEFNDWLAAGCSPDFISRIPIAMDGSCNGLQHYSAMLRDPRAGAAVNLTPSEAPNDIYGEVAKVVMAKLEQRALMHAKGQKPEGQTDEEALEEALMAMTWWEFGIDRKITKRPVMVLPYGGTIRSCMDYVIEAVKERPDCPYKAEELPKAGTWLAKAVWESIGEVVVSARLAMGWLKETASKVSKEGKPLTWTTPCGFPVLQAYPETKLEQIETSVLGGRFRPSLRLAIPDSIDARRQANGVAPNFVHSLDASALVETVLLAAEKGVKNFAMIHDSYGTTAGASKVLAEALRVAFRTMYEENDVLDQFRLSAVPKSMQESVGGIPHVGGLDLSEVEKSLYFFA